MEKVARLIKFKPSVCLMILFLVVGFIAEYTNVFSPSRSGKAFLGVNRVDAVATPPFINNFEGTSPWGFDGFIGGQSSNLTQTAGGKSGSYRMVRNASFRGFYTDLNTPVNTIYISAWVRFASTASTVKLFGAHIANGTNYASEVSEVWLSSGVFSMWSNGTPGTYNSSITPSANTWYLVQAKITAGSAGAMELKVTPDGGSTTTTSITVSGNSVTGQIARARMGSVTDGSDSATVTDYDTFQVSTTGYPDGLENTAPTITVNPSTSYSGYTRTSASVNWTMSFTATDPEQTGANALTYYVHTGASRTGTQVATGTFTSGSAAPSFSYASSGLGDGTNTVYLSIYDGSAYAATNPSFTVLRDSGVPNAATSISTSPSIVTSNNQYTVTFTSSDTYSTSANELAYNIRTAAGGGGTLLTSGTATSSTPKTTATITDAALAAGANTRYVRVCDGGSNCTDTSFTATKEGAPTLTSPTQTSITSSGATLGGNVTSDGGSTVTGRGVCVGASANPTLGGTCFTTTGTTGVFTVSATSLNQSTLYHYRAYATNAINTSYTTDDSFTTTTFAAPAISTSAETNVDGTTTTLNGTVNPNSISTTAYFLWGPANVSCANLPNFTTVTSMGSGGSNLPLTATVYGLIPNQRYYYCAVSYSNSTTGGVTLSSVSFFDQGAGSGCLSVPLNNDYTVATSCKFASSAVDGVDKGAGAQNEALLTFSKETTFTVGAGQAVAFGSLYKPGASVVTLSGGSLRRGAIWVPDTDGDGYPDYPSLYAQIISTSQPANYVRRSSSALVGKTVDCAPNDNTKWKNIPGYPDADNDTYTSINASFPVCSGDTLPSGYSASTSGIDCDETNAYIFNNVASLYNDADNDGYYTGSINNGNTCVGAPSTINTRTYYKGPTGTPGSAGASPFIATGTLGGNDCSVDFSGLNTSCAPTATNGSLGTVTATSAILNGTATAGTYTGNGRFRYSTSNVACASLGTTSTNTALSLYTTSNPSQTVGPTSISSLTGNTTYYWCTEATNTWNGSTVASAASTLNFLTPPGQPTSVAAGSATQTTLTVTWANPAGGATSYNIKWCSGSGCTPGAGGTITGQTSGYVHNIPLTCGTIYKYSVVAVGSGGATTESAASSETSTTSCASAPSVTTSAATGNTATTEIFNSTINPNGASTAITYRWGTTNIACSSLANTVAGPSGLTGSSPLSGATTQQLTSSLFTVNTTYYYCATANNGIGGQIYGSVLSFTTFCYRDADGDTYGAAGGPYAACGAGYITNATDCWDGSSATNPGVSWSSSATPRGDNGTFDWNCSGGVTKERGSDQVASWFSGTMYYLAPPYSVCSVYGSAPASTYVSTFQQATCGATYNACTSASSYYTTSGCSTTLYSCSGSVTQRCY